MTWILFRFVISYILFIYKRPTVYTRWFQAWGTDDYAKEERFNFCVVFTISLCILELKQMLLSLLFQIPSMKLGTRYTGSERSWSKLTFEYDLPNAEVSADKDESQNYIKVKSSLVCHHLHGHLLL